MFNTRMIRAMIAALALGLGASTASAGQFDGFAAHADAGSLGHFTRDLGAVLGAGTFHGARSLGFSGFDIGGRVGGQFNPSKGNRIMRNNGVKLFGLPWVQAEIGLPFKLDGFIRGVSFQNLTIAGGGARYGIYSASDKPWAPHLLATVVGHSVVHPDFSASHFGASVVASAGIPAFSPYAGVGFDRTRLVARQAVDPAVRGRTAQTMTGRYTLGARFRFAQFGYLNLAAFMSEARPGAEAGLGVRF
jgi:hypothetical protein